MGRYLIIISFLIGACTPVQQSYTPKIVPKCPKVQLSDGSYACKYTLEQVKTIYKVGAELDYRRNNDDVKTKDWLYYAVMLASGIMSVYAASK